MKCPLEIQMDTSAPTITTSSVRAGGVRCMRTNAEKVAIVEEAQQHGRSVATDALIGPNRDIKDALGESEIEARSFARRSVTDWFEEPAEYTLEEIA